jgi:hypothetical protein
MLVSYSALSRVCRELIQEPFSTPIALRSTSGSVLGALTDVLSLYVSYPRGRYSPNIVLYPVCYIRSRDTISTRDLNIGNI